MGLLDSLNPEQKKAVTTINGPLLMLAGAGSGKTKAITHRIAYMIEQGIDPFNILALTFTNKAAREMRERVRALTPQGDTVWISTFHSMCVRVLRREISKIGYGNNFTIYDADDAEKLMKTVLRELEINEKNFPAKVMLDEIGNIKDQLILPANFEKTAGDYRTKLVSQAYSYYQKKLKAANALDFDDLIFQTIFLFVNCSEVLEKYQNRFVYIMVDEYQDTNASQFKLIQLLSQKNMNLCVVGDDDQSIYGWRGADVRNILDFEKGFPNTRVIKLEQNYRSTGTILSLANEIISKNLSRKTKTLWTENNDGDKVTVLRLASDLDEADYISHTILYGIKKGRRCNEFAILYRQNSQSRTIEDYLVKKNIPYKIYGGTRFYERREIKDILAYCKAISNPFDDVALKRIINVPKRGIGDSTVDKISEYAAKNDMTFFRVLKDHDVTGNKRIGEFVSMVSEFAEQSADMKPSELIQQLLDRTGYMLELMLDKATEGQDRVENVKELVSKASEYEKATEADGGKPTLAGFLEEVALVADIDSMNGSDEMVSLMTLHSSKGLEFPIVFLPGFEEGLFPNYRSLVSGSPEEMEEERRLCYVGITRACQRLIVTCANQRRQNGQMVYNTPSRFLKDFPPELVDSDSAKQISGEKKVVNYSPRTSAQQDVSGFGAKSYGVSTEKQSFPAPKDGLDFNVGDSVSQIKYGVGKVIDIKPAGADFEVTVEFVTAGVKKFMAHMSKLKKA